MKNRLMSNFWKRFHTACRRKGKSRSWAAAQLGVKYPTFCGWMARHQFARVLLPRLEELLGWKVTEGAARQLGVSLIDSVPREIGRSKPIPEMLSAINERYKALAVKLKKYADMTNELFEALSAGTFFIYTSSTVSPLEFLAPSPHSDFFQAITSTRRSMARAVMKGCYCLYVQPSKLVTDYYGAWR